jgi:lysophospholipid acyltransferase (LPLAT)-like uncharacterized protein
MAEELSQSRALHLLEQVRLRGGNAFLKPGFKRGATRAAASAAIRTYIDFVLLTSRFVLDDPHDCLRRYATGMIGACWHHRLAGLLLGYRHYFGRGFPSGSGTPMADPRELARSDRPEVSTVQVSAQSKLAWRSLALISASEDGELIARIFRDAGGNCVRGSTSRGGGDALRTALAELERGAQLYVTPDGPRGPAKSVAAGIVELARHSGAPIVPVSACFSRGVRLERTWDRFELPLPFARITFLLGEPVFVAAEEPRDAALGRVRVAMEATTARADALPAKTKAIGRPRERAKDRHHA